jgi:hypothetical protein
VELLLDFGEERLGFDPVSGIQARDDGTADAASDILDVHRFLRDYWLNGILHIHHADEGRLLARKDGFLPVNIDPGSVCTHFDAEIARWQDELTSRRGK